MYTGPSKPLTAPKTVPTTLHFADFKFPPNNHYKTWGTILMERSSEMVLAGDTYNFHVDSSFSQGGLKETKITVSQHKKGKKERRTFYDILISPNLLQRRFKNTTL